MLGTQFYDEIYAEQRHIRAIEHICREAPTEEKIMLLSDNLLTKIERGDGGDEQTVGQQALALLPLKGCSMPLHNKTIHLFEEAPEQLLTEIGSIPYPPTQAERKRVCTRSQILLANSISMEELRSCCSLQNIPCPQYPPKFRNRHYHITKAGRLTLISDEKQESI